MLQCSLLINDLNLVVVNNLINGNCIKIDK